MNFTVSIVSDVNAICAQSEGRDKVACMFQYAARALVGFISFFHPKVGSPLFNVDQRARTMMFQLASARRTHRWCKELPVLQSLPQALAVQDRVDRGLELAQKSFLAAFMITDHIGMLQQWQMLPGGKQKGMGTIKLGFRFFLLSNLAGLMLQLRKLSRMKREGSTSEQRKLSSESALKHGLRVFQMAHVSQLYPTHDAVVGLAGITSSWLDVVALLPKKTEKIHPDAKGKPK